MITQRIPIVRNHPCHMLLAANMVISYFATMLSQMNDRDSRGIFFCMLCNELLHGEVALPVVRDDFHAMVIGY
jgi:hypothetical protein